MKSKSQYLKDWRRKNAAHVKAYTKLRAPVMAERHLQKKYGISTRQRNQMLRAQGYRCAGCRQPKSKIVGSWHTDHCHRTERVRGILCRPCNLALGFARDVPSTLRRLADYLEK